MATAPYLFTETRLNLDQALPDSNVNISLPRSATFPPQSPSSRQLVLRDGNSPKDEEVFARQHLAVEASIFFRRIHSNPSSILWRLLDDRKVLELQAVDLSKDKHSKNEACLTLALRFTEPIRPFGIAFAEPEDRDALHVFAMTTAGELYTINVNKDFFVQSSRSDRDAREFCKSYTPSSFSFRFPYRIVAISALELLVSMHNGSILRLDRGTGEDGSKWRETFFSEDGWNIRSILPFQSLPGVRFEGVDLDITTSAAMAASPDQKYIFSVCLNHTLRAWSVKTGRVVEQTDLLAVNHRDTHSAAAYHIAPFQKQLMQILPTKGSYYGQEYAYHVVTYSPANHQFKFWAASESGSSGPSFKDVNSHFSFIPPVDEILDTTIWALEEFHVKATDYWKQEVNIWIRVRSGNLSKLFTLSFDFVDEDGLEQAWRHQWAAVDEGSLSIERLKPLVPFPPSGDPDMEKSISEQWLQFLFSPGRFTTPTLETALLVFQRGSGQSQSRKPASSRITDTPLQTRVCDAISYMVTLRVSEYGEFMFDLYETEMSAQWHTFYALVVDLHRRRAESMSFAFDTETSLPWLVRADFLSPIRVCSGIELDVLNLGLLSAYDLRSPPLLLQKAMRRHHKREMPEELTVARLLGAARVFRSSYPLTALNHITTDIGLETLRDSALSVPERIKELNQRCRLCKQVTDDHYEAFVGSLDNLGGAEVITNELLFSVLEGLSEQVHEHGDRNDSTRFGAKSLVRGAQDTLVLGETVLLDLVALVVFLDQELEPQELSEEFDAPTIFMELLMRLRDYQALSWLCSNIRQDPKGRVMTLMESIFIGDFKNILFPRGPLSDNLTHWIRVWTLGNQIASQYDITTSYLFSNLLQHGDIDLAEDFLPHLNPDPWVHYLRGRFYLLRGDFPMAAAELKSGSYMLAAIGRFNIEDRDLIPLLQPIERDHFSDGLPRYFTHVLSLFDKQKQHAYVVEFANLGLQAIKSAQHGEDISEEDENMATDFRSRLFSACIQLQNWQEAYTTLLSYTNVPLRNAALTSFVKALISAGQMPLLLSLPWMSLADDVENVLSSLAFKYANIEDTEKHAKLLYSWRTMRGDFRGAAMTMWELLQRLKASPSADLHSESILTNWLILVNLLSCVAEEEAWLLAESGISSQYSSGDVFGGSAATNVTHSKKGGAPRRRIVTLADVRKEYQEELDRAQALAKGRFSFMDSGGEVDMDLA
ncbi:hypothetical protein K402DRAFT_395364 [Aulographum hederae CBS 113979]|uniref:Nucleoporin Nup120/160-domain-containing protein n=1 Tax=Aulographum hederae CBS 113979 TaxID=1176131 RepID=A0A6G1GV32_9PEZI|nr:hypothetical protein K402DRAFT_395364 [Aulographum hederae CBS 113979]